MQKLEILLDVARNDRFKNSFQFQNDHEKMEFSPYYTRKDRMITFRKRKKVAVFIITFTI